MPLKEASPKNLVPIRQLQDIPQDSWGFMPQAALVWGCAKSQSHPPEPTSLEISDLTSHPSKGYNPGFQTGYIVRWIIIHSMYVYM